MTYEIRPDRMKIYEKTRETRPTAIIQRINELRRLSRFTGKRYSTRAEAEALLALIDANIRDEFSVFGVFGPAPITL